MCIRLNNVNQSKDLLKYFSDECNTMLQKHYNQALNSKTTPLSNFHAVHIKNEAYSAQTLSNKVAAKIDKIQNGLLMLLAFRFNAFCKQAKVVLLAAELDAYPIEVRLRPLVDFLTCNLDMLKKNLYPHLLVKFVNVLWDFFQEVSIFSDSLKKQV